MIEFNVVNTDPDSCEEFPDWCCMVYDYPEVLDGSLELIDPDEIVSFSKTLNVIVKYPGPAYETSCFSSDTGFTRVELFECIFAAYIETFGKTFSPEYLGCLFLEGAEISPKGDVELIIGT